MSMGGRTWMGKSRLGIRGRLRKMMKCICSGEQLKPDELVYSYSSESLATRDYSASGYSSKTGEVETKVDRSNIEEAESSLRESGYLNYEEARALLGRLEYQKGNIEAALHVFEGIDIASVTPKMRITIARRCEPDRHHSQSDDNPSMSMHAVSLLLEAVLLKAKSLQALGRFQEAAKSCKTILDTVEFALPEGLPENYASACKLQETLTEAVELLPELWKLVASPQDVVSSYRRALLYHWNLDINTTTKIQKEFAVFLLYGGYEANPHSLRSQLEGFFVPRNNLEEAILLLLILMGKSCLGRIGRDPSLIDHLSFALSVSGEFWTLAQQVDRLLPGTIESRERYSTLALCYYAEGENMIALNVLRNLLRYKKGLDCILEFLLASKICVENTLLVEEGISYACRAVSEPDGKCWEMVGIANCFCGILLSSKSKLANSESERIRHQSKALDALEKAHKMMRKRDPYVVFQLSLEHAEQRKLDIAFYYAKLLIKLEAGSSIKGYLLLVRILSAQKRFIDAETVVDVAVAQSGKWNQGELLRTKAKLQIAQGQLKNAVETFTHLLAVIQVQAKSLGFVKKLVKNRGNQDRSLEMETWNDLANVYTHLSQWNDAEVCLSKSQAINPYSASRWHSTGLLYEAKGLPQEALKSFRKALDVDPNHVPSLISTACVLRKLGCQSLSVVRSFLTDALKLDAKNPTAWYNLGLVYKADVGASTIEAAECFEAAALLEESAPIEPFR